MTKSAVKRAKSELRLIVFIETSLKVKNGGTILRLTKVRMKCFSRVYEFVSLCNLLGPSRDERAGGLSPWIKRRRPEGKILKVRRPSGRSGPERPFGELVVRKADVDLDLAQLDDRLPVRLRIHHLGGLPNEAVADLLPIDPLRLQ